MKVKTIVDTVFIFIACGICIILKDAYNQNDFFIFIIFIGCCFLGNLVNKSFFKLAESKVSLFLGMSVITIALFLTTGSIRFIIGSQLGF